ncbi:MAG: hypothetical protein H6973_13440 [Gammaproteobacteria bacterium]|nr:hypothetical protein [Gammaproteobacteria bacterium]
MIQDADNKLKVSTRVIMLKPGMHIFRYASKLPRDEIILLTLQPAPLGKGTIDFFPAEGVSRNTLSRLGDCVIVRVRGDQAGILVAEYHLQDNTTSSVDLRIDRIDTSENLIQSSPLSNISRDQPAMDSSPFESAATMVNPSRPATPSRASPAFELLQLFGHIERRGDVSVTNDWLGDPNGQARLEGFAIEWKNRSQDVDLVYTCRVEGIGQTPAIFSGGYAGTRRKAAPITAVSFALAGPKAADFELSGQVVFASGPPLAIVSGQKLSGPKGSEHLVALFVSIAPKKEATVSRFTSPWDDPRITQIFRAN